MEPTAIQTWDSLSSMGSAIWDRAPFVFVGAVVFLCFYLVARSLRILIRRVAERRRRHRNLGIVLGRITQFVLVVVGLLAALVIILPGFKPVQLVEFLGLGTLAVGFVFRDILQNFLAGILILLSEPFRIGDQIVSGEFEGEVEEIQTRATAIRTYDGRRIVIPNSNLFTGAVVVNTAFEVRRLEYDVGVGVGDDLERAKGLILQTVRSVAEVLPDPPPDVLVTDFVASAVKLRVRWWIQPPRRYEFLESRDRVLMAIKRTLVENGIDLPFETRMVLFHDQTEETDGDRKHQREGWPAGNSPAPRPLTVAGAILGLAQAVGSHRADPGQRGSGEPRRPE